MKGQPQQPTQATINPSSLGNLVNVSNVHINVSQSLIVTTEDKIRIHLSSHLAKIERKKNWIAPLGILITIVVTLLTTDFKTPGLVFSPPTWKAVFIIGAILSGIWLIYAVYQALNSEKMDDLIERLKRESK